MLPLGVHFLLNCVPTLVHLDCLSHSTMEELTSNRCKTAKIHQIEPRGVLVFLNFYKILVSDRFCESLCSVDFHALTLKLPIQTSFSVAPKLQVCVRSGEKCRKTSTSLAIGMAFKSQK